MATHYSVDVRHEIAPGETVIAAFSNPGMAGLTTVEYLIDQLDLRERGYITIDNLPPIAPFQDGRPYHHTRFFSRDDLDITILACELPVPLQATDAFAQRLLEWVLENDVDEVTILTGMSVRQSTDDQDADAAEGTDTEAAQPEDVFFVASDDYRAYRLAESGLRPMSGGFLNGIHASLISQAMETPLRVGVLSTPTTPRPISGDAALRLTETVRSLYGIDVDTSDLEAFAAEMERFYAELTERVEQENLPEDRMFM